MNTQFIVRQRAGRWVCSYTNGRDLTIECQSYYLSEVLSHIDKEFQGTLGWQIKPDGDITYLLIGTNKT